MHSHPAKFVQLSSATCCHCLMTTPDVLPTQENLITASAVVNLASRHQILLSLVGYRSFAFDIDDDGKQVRLVGNFKGGGKVPLVEGKQDRTVELSAHAGVSLGPHTAPPYNCSVKAEDEHSPAPSALILTARWNPQREPTRLIPMRAAVFHSISNRLLRNGPTLNRSRTSSSIRGSSGRYNLTCR